MTPAVPQAEREPELPRITWLDAHDAITPERWLASRAAQADVDETDPAVAALRTDLQDAARRFGDEPRMIANRAVQLERMLEAEGIDEPAPDLIALLTSTASAASPKQGFGSLCQHYFNLRRQGLDRDAAVRQLKQAGHSHLNRINRG